VFAAWFITRFEAVFSTIAVEDEGFARCELLRISLPRTPLNRAERKAVDGPRSSW
jgi:hypothetical protein